MAVNVARVLSKATLEHFKCSRLKWLDVVSVCEESSESEAGEGEVMFVLVDRAEEEEEAFENTAAWQLRLGFKEHVTSEETFTPDVKLTRKSK